MKKTVLIFLALFLVMVPSSFSAELLSLEQLQRMALERNLDLQAQEFTVRASRASELKGFGLYDPHSELQLTVGDDQSPLNLFYTPTINSSESRYRQMSFSLTQKLPSGADAGLSYTTRRQNDFPTPWINPAYTDEVRLSLRQPLLRNFGRLQTEQTILLAARDREVAIDTLLEQAFQLVAQVREAYFTVLGLRDTLYSRQTSVSLAAQVLEENKAKVKAGVLPPHEILEAEVGLNSRETELLEAQKQYMDALDGLSLLIAAEGDIALEESPLERVPVDVDEEVGYRQALLKRPDIQRTNRQLDKLALEKQLADNHKLPSVDLLASYGLKGLGSGYSDSWDNLSARDYPNWEIGVSVSYPLGNREADYDAKKSRFQTKSLEAQLKGQELSVRKEIRTIIRALDISHKKIDVSTRGREAAEDKLRILLKRKDVGLATTRDVLEGEKDLAQARTDLILALVDYNRNLTEYLRVTGLLLEKEGIAITRWGDPDDLSPIVQMTP